jgi:hypothetical protein
MADRTDSFLREVDEDVRRDQLLKLWEKYGVLVAAGVVALFAAVGGYQWWKSSRISAQEATGSRFEAATRLAAEGKVDEAMKAFADIAKSAPPGYQALARLRIAAEHVKGGRTAEALATYEGLAQDRSSDDLMRDFAALQAAVLRLDQADWTEMKNRLTPLTDDKRPWHAPAREVLGLAAYRTGNPEEATKLYEQILGDRATTGGLSRRAQEMLAILNDQAAAKAASQQKSAGGGTTAGAKDEKGGKDAATRK